MLQFSTKLLFSATEYTGIGMIASMGEETVVKKMFKNFVYDILNLVSANLVFSKLLKSWQTQSRITLSNILCVTTGFKKHYELKNKHNISTI